MGIKLLWIGLTFIQAAQVLRVVPFVDIVGAVLMVIGVVLFTLDK